MPCLHRTEQVSTAVIEVSLNGLLQPCKYTVRDLSHNTLVSLTDIPYVLITVSDKAT